MNQVSTVPGFNAPVEDILFSLNHIGGASSLAEWDSNTAADILNHFACFAEQEIAPLNAIGDSQGARLEAGKVRLPDGFADVYTQLAEDGWQGLTAPEEFGGMGGSSVVAAGVSEIFSGANHALQMICNLVPGAISILLKFGSEEQQQLWIPKLASGEALSTMCLTEPGAGSDLSAIKCLARKAGDAWQITGEKIFISGGDQDLSEEILHLVLARSGAADSGLAGLSLFLCPAQTAVTIVRIEEKLGLHASPTCQMSFEAAQAQLIGEEGAGLKAMFTLMNHARIDVALQGVAHASHAARLSRNYADERPQGRLADGSAALLSEHADVQRMLDEQQALAIGARAMCHITLVETSKGIAPALAEFLTSLCKIFGSEAGIRAADLGIQILGGYGYLNEYGVGQIWRDARITSIYEGTNGIHARTLLTRGLSSPDATGEFANLVNKLGAENPQIAQSLRDWYESVECLTNTVDPLPWARDFATQSAELFYKAAWAKVAAQASHHSQPNMLLDLAEKVLRQQCGGYRRI